MTRSVISSVFVIVLVSSSLTGASPQPPMNEPGGLCCLCMCHSADENKCAGVCVKMQRGTKIIEEPEMTACTKSCVRHAVKQIFLPEDSK